MSLLNTVSGRILREGDDVKILVGTRSGLLGTVVGANLMGPGPAVTIQYAKRQQGILREAFSANDLEFIKKEGADLLEPLPPIEQLLQEGQIAPVYMTCGVMLCLTLTEDNTVLTCVPHQNGMALRKMFESRCRKSISDATREVLQNSFVTRMPHLVKIGKSEQIESYLSEHSSPDSLVESLLRSSQN